MPKKIDKILEKGSVTLTTGQTGYYTVSCTKDPWVSVTYEGHLSQAKKGTGPAPLMARVLLATLVSRHRPPKT